MSRVRPASIRAVWQGRAPNCSSSGSVVGAAILTLGGVGALLHLLAARLSRPRTGDEEPLLLRKEADGAVVFVPESGDKVHLDAEGAKALAADAAPWGEGEAVPGALSAPTEVHVSLGETCGLRCTACYIGAGPDRAPSALPPASFYAELAQMGVFEVALGGGERGFDAALFSAIADARRAGLRVNLTTSGLGLSAAAAACLAGAVGQVNISLDGLGPIYAAVRGFDGSAMGISALHTLRAAGVKTGVNTVLSRALLERPGALHALGAAIAEAGAEEWQWLRMKPSGRGRAAWSAVSPPPEALDGLLPRLLAAEAATGLRIRVDCALLPFVVDALEPAQAAAMGLRGCPGGQSLLTRSADGGLSPCSFVASSPADSVAAAWSNDATLLRWRGRAAAPPEPCAACPHQAVCRGGCRAVAEALTGDALAPDPQCPRVRAHARG